MKKRFDSVRFNQRLEKMLSKLGDHDFHTPKVGCAKGARRK
jgi:hypothetical protein